MAHTSPLPFPLTRASITSKPHFHNPFLCLPKNKFAPFRSLSPARSTPDLAKTIMSQKTEKEETVELKVPPAPETLATALCTENCKIPAASAATSACNAQIGAGSASPDPARLDPLHGPPPPAPDRPGDGKERSDSDPKKKAVNRCLCCAKPVGLTGFRCRCGELFCSVHRYSDRHDCSYDYKAAARETIARENPVVRAAKILKF